MFIAARRNKDSEYDSYCGLSDLTVFSSLDLAILHCQTLVDVTSYHREDKLIDNPARIAYEAENPMPPMMVNGEYKPKAYNEWSRKRPPYWAEKPLKDRKPYDEVFVGCEFAVHSVDENGHVNEDEPVWSFEDLTFCVYPIPEKGDDDFE